MAGTVVLFRSPDREPLTEHEAATQTAVALMLAELADCDFGGVWDQAAQYRERVLFVPDDTLVVDDAAQLGVASAEARFTGDVLLVESERDAVIPHPVIANYLEAFGHAAASVTHRVIRGADHGLSEERWRRAHGAMLA